MRNNICQYVHANILTGPRSSARLALRSKTRRPADRGRSCECWSCPNVARRLHDGRFERPEMSQNRDKGKPMPYRNVRFLGYHLYDLIGVLVSWVILSGCSWLIATIMSPLGGSNKLSLGGGQFWILYFGIVLFYVVIAGRATHRIFKNQPE